jgi:methylenetetrahydrofolate reductase (NADPH)
MPGFVNAILALTPSLAFTLPSVFMRFIRDIYAERIRQGRPAISLEFFTPKTEEGDRALFDRTLPTLMTTRPEFCSVTYGAGGSTRDKTMAMVERIQTQFRVPAMAHLTCVGSNRAQIAAILADARQRGIRNILALRGDPPAGTAGFTRTEGGFQYAAELVTLVREMGGFSTGVAGFPEGHVECRDGRHVDWERLRAKLDCGADFIVTQLFFDNRYFYEFRDYLTSKLGVQVPIIPGVISILSSAQIQKFTAMSGATIPPTLGQRVEQLKDDDEAVAAFGIEYATAQCADLLKNGVPGLHFYTLNKAHAATSVLRNLGLACSC